jgi:threonine dehydrogenase-like Zn-dependent dehydrogenase
MPWSPPASCAQVKRCLIQGVATCPSARIRGGCRDRRRRLELARRGAGRHRGCGRQPDRRSSLSGVANGKLKAAALLGRIVNVGRLGGQNSQFDFELHALKRINYIGVTFRTRTAEEVREINRAMRADLWPAVETGALSLPIDRVFPLDQVVDAQDHMRANRHLGKIVVTV